MLIHLYWVDKNWDKRADHDAHNEHLYVDYAKKIFQHCVNNYVSDNSAKNVEVTRRSDLRDYMKYLESQGFISSRF